MVYLIWSPWVPGAHSFFIHPWHTFSDEKIKRIYTSFSKTPKPISSFDFDTPISSAF